MEEQPKKSNTLRNALIAFGIVIVLAMIGLAAPSDSNTSTTGVTNPEESTSEDQGKVEVKTHSRKSAASLPSIVGELVNNTPSPTSQITITATLYDESGTVVDTDKDYLFDPVEPGATSPFEIVFLDSPVFATYKLDVSWD